jgi:hypothetical protein
MRAPVSYSLKKVAVLYSNSAPIWNQNKQKARLCWANWPCFLLFNGIRLIVALGSGEISRLFAEASLKYTLSGLTLLYQSEYNSPPEIGRQIQSCVFLGISAVLANRLLVLCR